MVTHGKGEYILPFECLVDDYRRDGLELFSKCDLDFQKIMNVFDKVIISTLSRSAIQCPVEYLWHLYHLAKLSNAKAHMVKELSREIAKADLDIKSDFSHRDAMALESVVQMVLTDDMVAAEIGSWKGMSAATIAKTIKPWRGHLYAIDHWKGSDGVVHHTQANNDDIFAVFRKNMQALGLWESIHSLVMDSETAATIVKNEVLSLLFIDADHRYSKVKKDIEMWLPKVKRGGIIAGHDCEEKYTAFGDYRLNIDAHKEDDVIVGVCHPGVVKALYDIFHDDFNIVPESSVWWKKND